jgi:hypothetical protein
VESTIRSVVLKDFDYGDWLSEKVIRGGLLTVGPSATKITRDNTYPFNKNQRPPWPQDLLLKIKQPFEVDSLYILPSTIHYIEVLEANDQEMEIRFEGVTATSGWISNIPKPAETTDFIKIRAKGKVAGEGNITLNTDFNLSSPSHWHHVSGRIEPLALNTFNPILEKSTNLTIEQGQLNRFDFDFTADDTQAGGELYFGYDLFKIGVYNIRHGDTIRSGLNSFLANSFVIDTKNPRGKTFEPEKITYQRDIHRSILNYWWKAIFESTKSVIGIKEKKPEKAGISTEGDTK